MNYRTLAIVILAVTFGLSAAVGVNLVLQQRAREATVETMPVVVATGEIPRGVTIAPKQLTTREWPKHLVPSGAIHHVEDARGRVTFTSVVRGEVLLEGKLSREGTGRGLASMVPMGMRAFTMHTPSVASGVAGFILPGNKVDVLLTIPNDKKSGGAITGTLLQNVEILAVDQRLDPPSENKVDPRILQSVTVLVTPEDATKLDLGQNRGTLHLSLRNPEDSVAAWPKLALEGDLLFQRPVLEQVKAEFNNKQEPPPVPAPAPTVDEQEKWTPQSFTEEFVTREPKPELELLGETKEKGLSNHDAKKLLALAKDKGLVHRWEMGHGRKGYATIPQPPGPIVTEIQTLRGIYPGLVRIEETWSAGKNQQ